MNIELEVRNAITQKALDLLDQNQEQLVDVMLSRPSMAGKEKNQILVEMRATIEAEPFGFLIFYEKSKEATQDAH